MENTEIDGPVIIIKGKGDIELDAHKTFGKKVLRKTDCLGFSPRILLQIHCYYVEVGVHKMYERFSEQFQDGRFVDIFRTVFFYKDDMLLIIIAIIIFTKHL